MNSATRNFDSDIRQDKRQSSTHKSNFNSEINNPCKKEEHIIFSCLNENNYDKDACQLPYMNYKNCKDFWYEVVRDRRKKGIQPYLPLPEERMRIKSEYLNTSRN